MAGREAARAQLVDVGFEVLDIARLCIFRPGLGLEAGFGWARQIRSAGHEIWVELELEHAGS